MVEQCPECGAATEAAPWCASCGAWLGAPGRFGPSADAGREAQGSLGGRVAAAAVAVLVAVAVMTSDPAPEVTGTTGTVPVEEAEVLPPTAPPERGPVGRQFAAEAAVVWERRIPAAAGPAWSLASDGSVVSLVADGEAVLAVDVATGADRTLRRPRLPGDLVFDVGGVRVAVEVGTSDLRGVVNGEDVWAVELEGLLAVDPIRTGTSLVAALTTGEVTAIAPSDGTERWRRDLGVLPTAVAGDGTLLLVGTADGRVLRLDPSGTPVTTAQVGEEPVLALTVGRPAVVLLADRLVGLDVAG